MQTFQAKLLIQLKPRLLKVTILFLACQEQWVKKGISAEDPKQVQMRVDDGAGVSKLIQEKQWN